MKRKLIFLLSGGLLLTGCGGNGGPGPDPDPDTPMVTTPPETAQGVFLDEAVEGLTFISGEQTGVTDENGTFTYEVGEEVTFSIGDIILGSAVGASVITPVDLVLDATDETDPTVTNIARLLQSLDDDGDPSNGITIIEAVSDAAIDIEIDFTLSIPDFTEDGVVQTTVTSLTTFTSAGARSLVSALSAQTHLGGTLIGQFAGNYEGTFTGTDGSDAFEGTYQFTLSASGSLMGSGNGDGGAFQFSGNVNSSGDASATGASGGVFDDTTTFQISIAQDGTITGTFVNLDEGLSGSIAGDRS